VDSEIALALERLGESTDRLLATADRLTDAQAAGGSRLPGWTRGHVLTHIARNADGFRNLLAWARTGIETPMYPSEESRARSVEAGAGRSAAELAADLRASAGAFAAAAGDLPAAAWDAPVARRADTFPARGILTRRRSELEIHHVDLDAGYQPDDWPADFVQVALARVARDFAGRADAPRLLACPEGQEAAFPIGPATPGPATPGPASTAPASTAPASTAPASTGPGSTVTVSGPPAALLAWLTGRDTGAGLEVAGADTVPVLPPWR
jgi:maleylpyruvate isomerase